MWGIHFWIYFVISRSFSRSKGDFKVIWPKHSNFSEVTRHRRRRVPDFERFEFMLQSLGLLRITKESEIYSSEGNLWCGKWILTISDWIERKVQIVTKLCNLVWVRAFQKASQTKWGHDLLTCLRWSNMATISSKIVIKPIPWCKYHLKIHGFQGFWMWGIHFWS